MTPLRSPVVRGGRARPWRGRRRAEAVRQAVVDLRLDVAQVDAVAVLRLRAGRRAERAPLATPSGARTCSTSSLPPTEEVLAKANDLR